MRKLYRFSTRLLACTGVCFAVSSQCAVLSRVFMVLTVNHCTLSVLLCRAVLCNKVLLQRTKNGDFRAGGPSDRPTAPASFDRPSFVDRRRSAGRPSEPRSFLKIVQGKYAASCGKGHKSATPMHAQEYLKASLFSKLVVLSQTLWSWASRNPAITHKYTPPLLVVVVTVTPKR